MTISKALLYVPMLIILAKFRRYSISSNHFASMIDKFSKLERRRWNIMKIHFEVGWTRVTPVFHQACIVMENWSGLLRVRGKGTLLLYWVFEHSDISFYVSTWRNYKRDCTSIYCHLYQLIFTGDCLTKK